MAEGSVMYAEIPWVWRTLERVFWRVRNSVQGIGGMERRGVWGWRCDQAMFVREVGVWGCWWVKGSWKWVVKR